MNFYGNFGGGAYQDIKSVVLLNTFEIDKKRYRVFYNNGLLIWEREKSNKSKFNLSLIASQCAALTATPYSLRDQCTTQMQKVNFLART